MVRRSLADAEQSRRRILRSASRLMRERGYTAAGIDAIAADAGLTPGAFYRHFPSKAELFAAVVDDALDVAERHMPVIQTPADVEAFAAVYLSHRAVRELGAGCIVTAMSADLARDDAGARAAAARYVELIQHRIEKALQTAGLPLAPTLAWQVVAQLVGGVVLARILPLQSAQAVLDSARPVFAATKNAAG